MLRLGQITRSQYNTATKVDDGEGGDFAAFRVEMLIVDGVINNTAELMEEAQAYNVPSNKLSTLRSLLVSRTKDIDVEIRRQANILSDLAPDATDPPEQKIKEATAKSAAIRAAFENAVNEYDATRKAWEDSGKTGPRPIAPTVRGVAVGVIEDEVTKIFEASRDEALEALKSFFSEREIPVDDIDLGQLTKADNLPDFLKDKLDPNQMRAINGLIPQYQKAQKAYLEHLKGKGGK